MIAQHVLLPGWTYTRNSGMRGMAREVKAREVHRRGPFA